MDFIKKKLFLILCIAVVLLGIGIFISGMMVSANNQKELNAIKVKLDSVNRLSAQAVPEDELKQAESDAEGYQKNLEQMELFLRETTRRWILYRAVFPKLNDKDTKDYHFEAFAEKYCAFVDRLLLQLHAGTCPSPQEEAQQVDQFFKDHMKGSTASSIDEAEQMDRIRSELRQKRARENAIYADQDSFCVYTHWKRLPQDAKPMYLDAWYTQLAAWIQEDVVAAIQELNGSSQSVLTSPVKRLLEISFAGEEPDAEPKLKEAQVKSVATYGSYSFGAIPKKYGTGRSVCVSRRYAESANKLPVYVTQLQQKRMGYLGSYAGGVSAGSSQYDGQLAIPFTGRYSNDVIDVVQFEVGVIIDTARIHDFIHALKSQKKSQVIRLNNLPQAKSEVLDLTRLQEVLLALQSSSGGTVSLDGRQINKSDIEVKEIHRNQITVLQMDVEPLDISVEQDAGYYYGSGSFKVLRLTCEYIFFKSGYADLMPEPVKEILNPSESQPKTGFDFGGGRMPNPGGMPSGGRLMPDGRTAP